MNEEKIIEYVSLEFIACNDGTNISFELGKQGITAIKWDSKSGEMSLVPFIAIYKDDKLFSELHHFSYVRYKQ